MRAGDEPGTLEIYVSHDCANCRAALALADAVRRRRPGQPLHVIDIARHRGTLPDGVIGTPTYRLGGKIISLGNPSWEELLDRLDHVGG